MSVTGSKENYQPGHELRDELMLSEIIRCGEHESGVHFALNENGCLGNRCIWISLKYGSQVFFKLKVLFLNEFSIFVSAVITKNRPSSTHYSEYFVYEHSDRHHLVNRVEKGSSDWVNVTLITQGRVGSGVPEGADDRRGAACLAADQKTFGSSVQRITFSSPGKDPLNDALGACQCSVQLPYENWISMRMEKKR